MKRCILSTTLCVTLCATLALYSAGITLPSAQQPPIPGSTAGKPSHVLFSEGFDDPGLLQRGWYDGNKFAISDRQPRAGKGCIEYAWKAGATTPTGSSGIRHLFEPTDTVFVGFYIKLSKGWGWSGRPYHPHLMHFMTTENQKFGGPAATHLTVYIEPPVSHGNVLHQLVVCPTESVPQMDQPVDG